MRALFALPLISLVACAPAPVDTIPGTIIPTGEVVLKVNETPITQDMIDATLRQLPEDVRTQLEQTGQLAQINEQLIMTELLYSEAITAGLHENADVQMDIAMAVRNALSNAILEHHSEQAITADKIQAWYDDHLVQFSQAEVKMSLIAMQTEETANEVKALLDGGGDFAALVAEHSIDPGTKANGGSLGEDWIPAAQLQGPLGAEVGTATTGTLIGPIQMGPYWNIFRVDESRSSTPLSEVEDTIRSQLKQDISREYITTLRDGATIDNLDGAEEAAAPEGGEGDAHSHGEGDAHSHSEGAQEEGEAQGHGDH